MEMERKWLFNKIAIRTILPPNGKITWGYFASRGKIATAKWKCPFLTQISSLIGLNSQFYALALLANNSTT